MSQLQSLLNLGTYRAFRKELARVLSGEFHGKFNVNAQRTAAVEDGLQPSCSINGNLHPALQDGRNQRDQEKKGGNHLQQKVTATPYNDGHQWRKYGEKKISGSAFPRSYYRCTYREDKGCQATKQVQQQGYGDPPLFLVTYKGEHTCNTVSTAAEHQHKTQYYQQKKFSQHQNCNMSSFFLLPNDRDYTCNNDMVPAGSVHQLMEESTPVQPFSLHYSSSVCMIEQTECFDRRSSSWQNSDCTLVGKPSSSYMMEPPYMAVSADSGENFLHETLSPSSIEMDMNDMMMDSLGFDFDNYKDLFQIPN